MYFALDAWLLPAIASGSSSYLVSLIWEKVRAASAPSGGIAAFLTALSFMMGGISAYLRHNLYATSLENNIIIMYIVGATTTFLWLLMRRRFTWMRRGREK